MERDREDRDEMWEDEDLFAVEGLDDDEPSMEARSFSDEELFEVGEATQDAEVDDAFATGDAFDGFDPSVDERDAVEEFDVQTAEASSAEWPSSLDDGSLWESEDGVTSTPGDAYDVSADVESFFPTESAGELPEGTVEFELGAAEGEFYAAEGTEELGETQQYATQGSLGAEETFEVDDAAEEWFDESEAELAGTGIEPGFQPSADPDAFEQAPGLQAGALAEFANQEPADLGFAEEGAEGYEGFDLAAEAEAEEVDEREFVSWDEDGAAALEGDEAYDVGTGAEADPSFRDPHRPLEVAQTAEYDEAAEFDEFDEHAEFAEDARPSRAKLFLVAGSVVAAASLVVLGKLVFLDDSGSEDDLFDQRTHSARITKPVQPGGDGTDPGSNPDGGIETSTTPGGETGETTETPGTGETTDPGETTEIGEATETGPESTNPGTDVVANGGTTEGPGTGENPATTTGELVASGGGETTPPLGPTDPEELETGELSELFPEGSGEIIASGIGAGEAEANLFKQEVRIPAEAWAEPNRAALMVADVIMHRSAVRVLLKNGNEFRGHLHKLDPQRIELKIDKGEIAFAYDDLSEVFPLEAPDLRLQHHPEGYVEFKNRSRMWGRIVENGPKAVTLAFGQTRILVPRHAIVAVEERPMFTFSLEPSGGARPGE